MRFTVTIMTHMPVYYSKKTWECVRLVSFKCGHKNIALDYCSVTVLVKTKTCKTTVTLRQWMVAMTTIMAAPNNLRTTTTNWDYSDCLERPGSHKSGLFRRG